MVSTQRKVYACGNDRWAVFVKAARWNGVCIRGTENLGVGFVSLYLSDLVECMQCASSELTLWGGEKQPIHEVPARPYLVELIDLETGPARKLLELQGAAL